MNIAPSISILLAAFAGAAVAGPVGGQNTVAVHGCFGDAHGNLSGGIFQVPLDDEAREFLEAMDVANQGIVDNRLDLVFVGDGYTAGEQGQFHTDVAGVLSSMYAYEPFTSYEPYFRVTEVEVISNESGVDNDPTQGINRDTALDMLYWCGGTERLLCVNVNKAYTAAAVAPDIDQVVALSNSSKYGGAGYSSSNLGTAAGQNSAAADIVIHELGHSLGDLADEYTYGGPTTYSGGEHNAVDLSIYNRTEQIAQSRKWHYWMDANMGGFDGPISTFEGGGYSQFGIYRPSSNSMMRALGRPFSLVNAEQLLKEIYREVDPIDDGTPDGATVDRDGSAWVLPMQPLDHDLMIYWYLDGTFQIGLFGQQNIEIASLGLDNDVHELRVVVVDETTWVRNEAMRASFMTEERTFLIDGVSSCLADLNGDGELDFFDVSAFLSLFGDGDLAADFNGDGELDFFDVSAFLAAFDAGCP